MRSADRHGSSRGLIAGLSLLTALPCAAATGIADDFESYTGGTFPNPPWLDAGALDPLPPVAPLPSATVVVTNDAFGNPTQAVSVADAISPVTGIYLPVAVSAFYSLAADIRVDAYSDNPVAETSDFAMQLTFARADQNLYAATQAGIYASSLTGTWRVFLLEQDNGIGADVDLGVAASVGTWYRVAFDLDATTGSYRARIFDAASAALLVDSVGAFAGWDSTVNGKYDAVAFIEGEDPLNGLITVSNRAVVDNINVVAEVPEGTSWSLVLVGLLALGGLVRRRASAA
jgi:hypothetical protein